MYNLYNSKKSLSGSYISYPDGCERELFKLLGEARHLPGARFVFHIPRSTLPHYLREIPPLHQCTHTPMLLCLQTKRNLQNMVMEAIWHDCMTSYLMFNCIHTNNRTKKCKGSLVGMAWDWKSWES